jgi:hypothetical protein
MGQVMHAVLAERRKPDVRRLDFLDNAFFEEVKLCLVVPLEHWSRPGAKRPHQGLEPLLGTTKIGVKHPKFIGLKW